MTPWRIDPHGWAQGAVPGADGRPEFNIARLADGRVHLHGTIDLTPTTAFSLPDGLRAAEPEPIAMVAADPLPDDLDEALDLGELAATAPDWGWPHRPPSAGPAVRHPELTGLTARQTVLLLRGRS